MVGIWAEEFIPRYQSSIWNRHAYKMHTIARKLSSRSEVCDHNGVWSRGTTRGTALVSNVPVGTAEETYEVFIQWPDFQSRIKHGISLTGDAMILVFDATAYSGGDPHETLMSVTDILSAISAQKKIGIRTRALETGHDIEYVLVIDVKNIGLQHVVEIQLNSRQQVFSAGPYGIPVRATLSNEHWEVSSNETDWLGVDNALASLP